MIYREIRDRADAVLDAVLVSTLARVNKMKTYAWDSAIGKWI